VVDALPADEREQTKAFLVNSLIAGHAGPGQNCRSARPQGDLRNHGGDTPPDGRGNFRRLDHPFVLSVILFDLTQKQGPAAVCVPGPW
jgi:hypothetical protein